MDTTRDQVIPLCHEAVHYCFPTVFVHPSYVALAVSILRGVHVRTFQSAQMIANWATHRGGACRDNRSGYP